MPSAKDFFLASFTFFSLVLMPVKLIGQGNACTSLCNEDFEDTKLVATGQFGFFDQSKVPCWKTTGIAYKKSGNYIATLKNRYGCDSILNLQLSLNKPTFYTKIMVGFDSFFWIDNGKTYYNSISVLTKIKMDVIQQLH